MQDKKRNFLLVRKMRKVSEEVEHRKVRFQLCRRSVATVGWQQIKILQAGEEREAAVRRSPTDVALIQPWWSRSSLVEQYMQNITSKPCRKNSLEDSRLQPLRSTWQEEKRELRIGRRMGRGTGGKWALRRPYGGSCCGSCSTPESKW